MACDNEAKRRFEIYLDVSLGEARSLAYRLRVDMIGKPELAARFREWRLQNPLLLAEIQRKSYSTIRRTIHVSRSTHGTEGRENWRPTACHTSVEIEQMLEDQGGLCAYCERALSCHRQVDHMIPLDLGGRNDWTNLAVICPGCNLSKGTLTVEQFLADETTNFA